MKKIVLELAKIVLFFIILWWVIVHITYILRNDTDEKENLMGFYAEEKNSLDAVFIGSSTMWASLNPLVMYNERGFTSYNIATSAQRPSSLKYLIKEAQKYQSDALYVIDVSNFVYDQSVWEEQNEGSLRRVTDGLKYSWNRFLCNYEQIKGKSNKISYYFDIIKYIILNIVIFFIIFLTGILRKKILQKDGYIMIVLKLYHIHGTKNQMSKLI